MNLPRCKLKWDVYEIVLRLKINICYWWWYWKRVHSDNVVGNVIWRSPCLLVVRAAVTTHHRLGSLNSRNVLSHSSTGLKPKFKVWEGSVLSRAYEGRVCSMPFSLVCRWSSSPCVCSHLCISVSKFPFCIRKLLIGLEPTVMTSF